jgi:hypothetical protein
MRRHPVCIFLPTCTIIQKCELSLRFVSHELIHQDLDHTTNFWRYTQSSVADDRHLFLLIIFDSPVELPPATAISLSSRSKTLNRQRSDLSLICNQWKDTQRGKGYLPMHPSPKARGCCLEDPRSLFEPGLVQSSRCFPPPSRKDFCILYGTVSVASCPYKMSPFLLSLGWLDNTLTSE